jgi:hypothetical protein
MVNFGTSGGREDILKANDAYIVSNSKEANQVYLVDVQGLYS